MNLLYFVGKNCSAGEKIIKGLNTFPDLKIEVLPLLEDLEHYWQQKGFYQNTIALFFINSEKELKRLLKLKSFFMNTPIILILPNKRQMFTIGAKLYPRYMSDFDNATYEIEPVLNRLIRKYKPHNNY